MLSLSQINSSQSTSPLLHFCEEKKDIPSTIQESTTIDIPPLSEETSVKEYNLNNEERSLENLFISLDTQKRNSEFFQTCSLIQKKLSTILTHREAVENPPSSFFTSQNGLRIFQFFLETSSSEEATSLLARATKLNIISQDSQTTIVAWISTCARYLNRSKWGFGDEAKQDVLNAYQTWTQAINLGVPLDKQTSLEAYLFLSNLYDSLTEFDDPESNSLAEKALKLFEQQRISLTKDSQKNEFYEAIKLIFPQRQNQVILLLRQLLSINCLDNTSIQKILEEILTPYLEKNATEPLHYKTLFSIKALFTPTNTETSHSKKPSKLSHSKQQPKKKDLSFYEKLEKALIITPEQRSLIKLERFKHELKGKNWNNIFSSLPSLIQECDLPLQKQFLISSLRQIFQEIPKFTQEHLMKVEGLIRSPCLDTLFKYDNSKINFLLDYKLIVPKDNNFLNIAFIQAIMVSIPKVKKNSSETKSLALTSTTSQRLAEFFTNVVQQSGSSKGVLTAVEKELKQVIPFFICVYNQNIGPHTIELIKLLNVVSLHGLKIAYSEDTMALILEICNQVLESIPEDTSQIESIHQLLETLNWSTRKSTIVASEQVRTYSLLIECLIRNRAAPNFSQYADRWIIRLLVNLKVIENNFVKSPLVLHWCKKLHQNNNLSLAEPILNQLQAANLDNPELNELILLFVGHFSKKSPLEAEKLLLTHSSILKKYSLEKSRSAAKASIYLLLTENSFEYLVNAWKLIEEYDFLNEFPIDILLEQFSKCSNPAIVDVMFSIFQKLENSAHFRDEYYLKCLDILTNGLKRTQPLALLKVLENFPDSLLCKGQSSFLMVKAIKIIFEAIKTSNLTKDGKVLIALMKCKESFVKTNSFANFVVSNELNIMIIEIYAQQNDAKSIFDGLEFIKTNHPSLFGDLPTLSKQLSELLKKALTFPEDVAFNPQEIRDFIENRFYGNLLEPEFLKYAKERLLVQRLKLRLKSNTPKDEVKFIKEFLIEIPYCSISLKKECIDLIYEKAFNFLLSDSTSINIELINLLCSQQEIKSFYFEKTYEHIEKFLNSQLRPNSTIQIRIIVAIQQLICSFIVLNPEQAKAISKLIQKYIFTPQVHHIGASFDLFNQHLKCVEILASKIKELAPVLQNPFEECLLLCKAYSGDTTIRSEVSSNPEKKPVIASMIQGLFNSASPRGINHFFVIYDNVVGNFSDLIISLLRAKHPETGRPLFQEFSKYIFIVSDEEILSHCTENYLNILYAIQEKFPENRDAILSTIRHFLMTIISSGLLRKQYLSFYQDLESLMPFYIDALMKESPRQRQSNSVYDLIPLFEIPQEHTEEQKIARGKAFNKWLTHLLIVENSNRLVQIEQYISSCKPSSNLFSGLPPNTQQKILKISKP